MKNTRKGIRSIISLQKPTNDSFKIISLQDHSVGDLQTITNTFKSFFSSVAAEVQSEVPFSYKGFLNIYHRPSKTRFSSQNCTKQEIIEIILNFKPKSGRTKQHS